VGEGLVDRLAQLRGRLERAGSRRHEVLLVDGVDDRQVAAQLLRSREPLLGGLGASEHRERPGAVHRELVAEHAVVDVAEDDEGLVDRLQRRDGAIRRDLDDGEDVVRVGVAPAGRELVGDADRLRRVVTPFFEPADAAERDREIAVGGHRRRGAGLRAREGRRVVLRRRARIGEAHREMAKRHRDGGAPREVVEALGDVLREAKRVRRARQAIELDLELRLRDVHVELLAQACTLGRRAERAGRDAELGLGVIGPTVDRGQVRAFDGEPRRVERGPRGWRARERRGELARPVDATRLAVTAEQAHRERRVGSVPAREDALDPPGDEWRLVARGEAVEQLGAGRDRHDVAVGTVRERRRWDCAAGVGKHPRSGRRRERRDRPRRSRHGHARRRRRGRWRAASRG
jgi:hypothetical protein